MIAAVLDTNVLVAGLVGLTNPTSTTGKIFRAWQEGRYTLIVSEALLVEVERTLHKPYFRRRLNSKQIAAILAVLRRQGLMVQPMEVPQGIAAHPEDDLILATAISGEANYLVTGDAAFLLVGRYQRVQICTAQAFLALLAQPA